MTRRRARAIALAFGAIAIVHATWVATVASWTYDEPAHLAWSERLIDRGDTSRPGSLDNSKTPLIVPHVLARRAAAALGASPAQERLAARAPTILLLAVLLVAIWRVGRAVAGDTAAMFATVAAALDPNLIGHVALATVDVAFALATLVTAVAALRFHEGPGPRTAVALGLAIAFAFTAKFTAVLLLPCVALLPPLLGVRAPWRRAIAAGALALATAWLAIAATYGFRGVAETLLPTDFLSGIAICLDDERTRAWNVYVLGAVHPDGVWYYMLVHAVVKLPIASLVGVVVGLAAVRRWTPAPRLLLAIAAICFAYFSFVFRTQVGFRYVLMVLPLVYVAAAIGLERLARRSPRLPLALGLCAIVELAPYAGNPLAFTNTVIWDKRLAHRVAADSNLHWGQTDARARAWVEARQQRAVHNPPRLGLGINVLDANWLTGVSRPERFPCVRARVVPDAHLFHTHLVFVVDERRLAALRATCPDEVLAP